MDLGSLNLRADLYRQNAFRILGLPSDATYRKITQQARRLTTALELRDPEALTQIVIGGFGGMPDEPAVRDASSQLGDPRKRLLNELFWFRFSDDDDQARKFLCDRRPSVVAEAVRIWGEAEDFGSEAEAAIATHNLAVFHHLLALELEAKFEAEEKRKIKDEARLRALRDATNYCWGHALTRWRAVLADAPTWEWIRGRGGAIGKGRLQPTDIAAIQKDASPELLIQIAQFLLRSAEKGRGADMDELRRVVLHAGFAQAEIDKAAKNALTPMHEQIHKRISNLKEKINTEKSALGKLTLELLNEAEPRLAVFIQLLGDKDQMVVELSDAICSAANLGQVAHWTNTKDDALSFIVLQRIVKLVRSPQLKKIVEENLSNFECFFCNPGDKTAADDSAALKVAMWKIEDINTVTRRYRQRSRTLNVPRCRKCAAASNRTERARQHPAVVEALSAGWRLGANPSQDDVRIAFISQRRR